MRTYRSLKSNGRLWCILAIDGGEEATTLARYGTLLERFADQAILTSQPDAKSTFLSGSHSVLDGVERCASLRLVADRNRAIRWAMNQAGPNDTILVLTGDRHQTAKVARTNLQKIEAMIEKEWDKADEANPKPIFKIVG
jgi:UDP-N-acetylmuramoyl-L-alanyl-D-glutamate--2,6-diaminopimelate ligase